MSRTPLDRMAQRQLVLELRILIDRARTDQRSYARLMRLISENPRSVQRPHVQYNIGPRRARWLADALGAHARTGANAISMQRTFAASAELSKPAQKIEWETYQAPDGHLAIRSKSNA